MTHSRRDFLRLAAYSVGGAALAPLIERLSLTTALAQGPSYKALVCIFLNGGNDGNNTVVPIDSGPYGSYASYASVRGASGLAIAQGSLLPITPASLGNRFGLHPNLSPEVATPTAVPGLLPLWQQGQLAVVCNVGPLVQNLTRAQYQSGGPRPIQLFSHSDQINQWQTSRSDGPSGTGWGGRTADATQALNRASSLPMITSISGTPIFTTGATTRPLAIAPAPTALNQVLVLNGFGTAADDLARRNAMNYLRTLDRGTTLVRVLSDLTQQALDVSAALSVDPTLTTVFPATNLGNQLRQVAKVIKANLTQPALGLNRQIFFCSLGGFDTHQTQVTNQANLLAQLSQAMRAFYNATVELGVAAQVTTFTLSDFGRTYQPSGSGAGVVGTDHAWGNHHFVMGGAVRGGDFYGVPGPNGTIFPTLQLSGPQDTDSRGRWIPTVSVEQYAATLTSWFGLAAADLPVVFPLINRFAPTTLGFLT